MKIVEKNSRTFVRVQDECLYRPFNTSRGFTALQEVCSLGFLPPYFWTQSPANWDGAGSETLPFFPRYGIFQVSAHYGWKMGVLLHARDEVSVNAMVPKGCRSSEKGQGPKLYQKTHVYCILWLWRHDLPALVPKRSNHHFDLLLRGHLNLFEPSPPQEARKIWARLDTPPRQCQTARLQRDHGVLLQEEHRDLAQRTLQPGSCSMRLLAISPAENQTSRPTFWQQRGPQTGCVGGPRTALPRRPPSCIWTLDGENVKVHWCRGEYVEK